MPFYEYECANCKFYVEVMQKISEAPLKKCPSCGKSALKKLISAPVFRLKGGGWYETDFKSDQEGKRNLAGGDEPEAKAQTAAPAADAKAGDSKAGDAKPESKPAEKPAAAASGSATSRSSAKTAAKSTKAASRPAVRPSARAAARRSAPKAKAKAGKRRGR